MARKGKLGGLDDYEISLIKGMMKHEVFPTDQDILAYFSRPGRTINNGRLSEIRQAQESKTGTGKPAIDRFRPQPIASRDEVEAFLAAPPPFDPHTGLDFAKDELIIKAREAMMLAVQGYNSTAIRFTTEIFVVLAIIAWTYLLLAHYQRRRIDCVYRDEQNQLVPTRHGSRGQMVLVPDLGRRGASALPSECRKIPVSPASSGCMPTRHLCPNRRHGPANLLGRVRGSVPRAREPRLARSRLAEGQA